MAEEHVVDSSFAPDWRTFVAGSAGGTALVLSGHPFDTIKVRVQTMGEFSSTKDALLRTVRGEGIRGLYKGVMSPLVAVPWQYCLSFGSLGMAKGLVGSLAGGVGISDLTIPQVFAAGAISGVATSSLTAPVELLKIKMQRQVATATMKGISEAAASLSPKEAKYRGLVHCMTHTVKAEGISGLYRGFGATILRDIPGTAFYYGLYELLKRAAVPEGKTMDDVGALGHIAAGAGTGVLTWSICFPLDFVKSTVQGAPEGSKWTISDVARRTFREKGIRGFYRGLLPCLMRAAPADAACFFAYEWALKALKKASPVLE